MFACEYCTLGMFVSRGALICMFLKSKGANLTPNIIKNNIDLRFREETKQLKSIFSIILSSKHPRTKQAL